MMAAECPAICYVSSKLPALEWELGSREFGNAPGSYAGS
jgi:hypothetical protein